jgi:condensin complex subunit 2
MLVGDGTSIPFNTQFFHDDDDDVPGFDDGFDGDLAGTADPGEQDLLADTQGRTRRVRPEFINYTKRAKRVDVRKLKENIWKGLNIPTPEQQPAEAEAMVRGIRIADFYTLSHTHRRLRQMRRVSQPPKKHARSTM